MAFDGIFDALWDEVTEQLPGYRSSRAEFEAELSERPDFRNFLRAWWPLLRPQQVLAWLADLRRLRRYADGVLTEAEIQMLADSFGPEPTVADVALLDELDDLLGTPPRARRPQRDPYQVAPGVSEVTTYADRMRAAQQRDRERPADYREYAHVVVDEAQDVSPMQWRMLGRRGRLAHGPWSATGAVRVDRHPEVIRARDICCAAATPRTPHHELPQLQEIFELAATVICKAVPEPVLPTPVRATEYHRWNWWSTVPIAGHRLSRRHQSAGRRRGDGRGHHTVVSGDAASEWVPTDDRVQVVSSRRRE